MRAFIASLLIALVVGIGGCASEEGGEEAAPAEETTEDAGDGGADAGSDDK